ncbi:MAG TPA: hypothetical protein DCX52_13930 [Massilia sp.]|nr:hypothetical protein [Massilia sp.]
MSSSAQEPIEIIDVILHYNTISKNPQVMVVIDRMPDFVYAQEGTQLMANDSGFYDLLNIAGGTNAFGGRKFDIKLQDGTALHCHGQVWSGTVTPNPAMVRDMEAVKEVGINTIEGLKECHVYCAGLISLAKLNDWLARNQPSYDYDKYDPRCTLAYQDELYRKYPDMDRPVCAKRARRLRKRGVTIRRHAGTGARGWSPSYERKKAEIRQRTAPDYKGRFHPDVLAARGAA